MDEPEADQLVVLECDALYSEKCIVRSEPTRYDQIKTLGWFIVSFDDYYECPECYIEMSDSEWFDGKGYDVETIRRELSE